MSLVKVKNGQRRCVSEQITEAFPWNETPRYLIRERYGDLPCCRHYEPWVSATSTLRLAVAELFCREVDRNNPSRVRDHVVRSLDKD
jgi:hypothetical protein